LIIGRWMGEPAARFMRALHDLLESPAVLFN
jgi:pyruvate/2-oxoglutarate dehydrogenase complex dihydrolipoamide acyltransferase (E2) component